jgi:hypothetical protein
MMAVTCKKLNGDTTFLLTFSATEPASSPASRALDRSTFTVLLDPWLGGDSAIFHPKFALAKHTVPPCIDHLCELRPPNVVIVSQDRTDHCHEATLRQLDPSLQHTVILAHAGAAKKIRGWKYFNPHKIHAFPTFSAKKDSTILRFHIPSPVPGANPGEVTFVLVPAKRDMTGLHNAVGITYRPPSFSSHFDLSPISSTFDDSASSPPAFSLQSPHLTALPPTPPDSPPCNDASSPPTPRSPLADTFFPDARHAMPSTLSPPTSPIYAAFRPKTISVIYSPHGITCRAMLPYVTTHLVANAALPLTLLLHPFDRVQNPWYLGGNISAGMPGGLEIAQNLLARCWVGAHDEDKESSGISVLKIVTQKHTVDEVRALVEKERRGRKVGVDVRALGCGEEMVLSV